MLNIASGGQLATCIAAPVFGVWVDHLPSNISYGLIFLRKAFLFQPAGKTCAYVCMIFQLYPVIFGVILLKTSLFAFGR